MTRLLKRPLFGICQKLLIIPKRNTETNGPDSYSLLADLRCASFSKFPLDSINESVLL